MKGKIMSEKRTLINVKEADCISVRCKRCGGETNLPLDKTYNPQTCGVCEEYFGESLVAFIKNLKENGFRDKFEVSLVSVEDGK